MAPEQLGERETPLLKVVQAGAPNFPLWIFGFITMFAVANSALINMLMAFALITFVGEVPALGGTTALLLLCVFTVVNIAVLVLRKDAVEHEHFRTPTILPVLGALACAFFAGPWTGRDPVQYWIAGILIAIGIALWFVTVAINRATGVQPAEPAMGDVGGRGPVN